MATNKHFWDGEASAEPSGRPMVTNEKIVAAAVHLHVTWSLPRPARHHTIMRVMNNVGFSQKRIVTAEQGFLTDEGRFVCRELAFDIAWKAKQFSKPSHPTQLFSEDLW